MRASVVVLGSGPTAVFAVEYLARHGVKAVLVGELQDVSILPVPTPDGPVSLLPVFPPIPAPAYPPSSPTNVALAVRRVGSAKWVRETQSSPDSLVCSLRPDWDAAAMAVKQFGSRSLSAPLDQVQEKRRRAYSGTPAKRAGYVQGLSPYLEPMREAIRQRNILPQAVRKWTPHDHLIKLEEGLGDIEYERLIYVGDLSQLVEHVGVDVELPPRAAAAFSTFVSDSPLVANQLVYDLDEDSPIFRSFTATTRVVVVQESQRKVDSDLGRALADTASDTFQCQLRPFGDRLVHTTAYPVESLAAASDQLLTETCSKLDIMRFGRNAANRYIDLHELDWEEIHTWTTM